MKLSYKTDSNQFSIEKEQIFPAKITRLRT